MGNILWHGQVADVGPDVEQIYSRCTICLNCNCLLETVLQLPWISILSVFINLAYNFSGVCWRR